jgi:hypothetical protein
MEAFKARFRHAYNFFQALQIGCNVAAEWQP